MAETYKRLASGVLTTSAADLYSASTGLAGGVIVKQIVLVNYSTADRYVQLWHTSSSGGTANQHLIRPSLTLPSSGMAENTNQNICMSAGDIIRGLAEASTGLNYNFYGVELST